MRLHKDACLAGLNLILPLHKSNQTQSNQQNSGFDQSYNQNPWQNQQFPPPPATPQFPPQQKNGALLAMGIVSLCIPVTLSWIPFLGFAACIVGLIFGIMAVRGKSQGNTAAFVTGLLGIILNAIGVIPAFLMLSCIGYVICATCVYL